VAIRLNKLILSNFAIFLRSYEIAFAPSCSEQTFLSNVELASLNPVKRCAGFFRLQHFALRRDVHSRPIMKISKNPLRAPTESLANANPNIL
jgi:hypothetical protein